MYIHRHMHTCIYISPQLVHARLCNGAAASLPWKLLRTYGAAASLPWKLLRTRSLPWKLREHRAGCRFRPPSCPFVEPAALLLARSQTCLLKKSDHIHDSS